MAMDNKFAWLIAFASCCVNLSIYGFWRSYGVFYVAILHHYKVDRQTASLPFILCCAVYHLIGPIIGLLSIKYSLRTLQLIGCLIATSGLILSYTAQEFFLIIIYIGLIQGLGLGVIRTLSNVVIQEYFIRHRATATGISMAGGTVGSFFFPTIAQYVIDNYGLKIGFLIFGLIIFQASIGIIIQKSPKWRKFDGNKKINTSKMQDKTETIVNLPPKNTIQSKNSNNNTDENNISTIQIDIEDNTNIIDNNNCTSSVKDKETLNSKIDQQKSPESLQSSINNTRKSSVSSLAIITEVNNPIIEKVSAFQMAISVLLEPMFWIICITSITYNVCLQTYLMCIVDMSMKLVLATPTQAIFLLTLFSIFDLIGRVSFGWVSDNKIVKLKNISILCHLSLAICLIIAPNAENLLVLQLISSLIGLLIGIITVLWPILNVNYFGLDKLAIATGFECFFSGFESLLRPLLIGYYLDKLTRYDLLIYTVGGLVIFTMILWIIEPCINKPTVNSNIIR